MIAHESRVVERKTPACAGVLLTQSCLSDTGFSSSADLDAVSWTGAFARAATKNVASGNDLHPQCVVALVVRGGACLTQRIQTAQLNAGRRGSKTWQFEHYP